MAIDFLYTEIGRGHPFYLDGIRDSLSPNTPHAAASVFDCSRGISLLGWQLARTAYRLGSSTAGGGLYSRLRGTQKRAQNSALMDLLVRDIRARYGRDDNRLIVAHPLLVTALQERTSLFYQHGEVVAPAESLQTGRHCVFVPTTTVADAFLHAGLPANQIVVTGLCIEHELEAQSELHRQQRRSRYDAGGPLTLALYSSGAEPWPHVRQLVSCAGALLDHGDQVIAFCRRGQGFHRKLQALSRSQAAAPENRLTIVCYDTRQDLHDQTLAHFAAFDAFVAPAHERANWALGLGLPHVIAGPCIGTFAPLNRDVLLNAGVACDLPADIGTSWAAALHEDGRLAAMSDQGWGHHNINGFRTIADALEA